MSVITVVKEKDLVRDIIIEKLQEKLPEHSWNAVSSRELEKQTTCTYQTDLLLVDIHANVDCKKIIEDCRSHSTRIAIWATEGDQNVLRDFFRYGLNGYFYNGMELSELIFAINSILQDQQYIHPKLSAVLLKDYVKLTSEEPERPKGILTEQEWKVLEELGKGLNNCSIAKELFISTRTVNNHVSSILKKLHVSDRTNAVIKAIKNKWITL
ncbi:response regulator transcription factor [Ornithinibacillus bavariensis]|uniref:response regulator transcription factor n=1 Tax=Ornithinibacillus bavariensis TaxID=545502 RepID=UPI000EE158BC|nr:DNA-binding response regulator [Ornithinibacillus sp.]